MADQIYRILLDDYSCPEFVSALKAYYDDLIKAQNSEEGN